MGYHIVHQGLFVAADENKTGTEPISLPCHESRVNPFESVEARAARYRCAFVVRRVQMGADGAWPFCGRPVVHGSAYCARHRRICVLSSESAAELAAEAEVPEPPPELAYLSPEVLPEPQPEEQPAEFRALLDHPPPKPDLEDSE